MKRKRHVWLERGKSLLILLLTLSAVYLSSRTLFYSGASGRDGLMSGLDQLLSPGGAEEESPLVSSALAELTRPVRVAVTTPDGRYGAQYDPAAVDGVYEASASLLAECLLRAGAPVRATAAQWRQALERTGIYYDFLGEMPLSVLAAGLGQSGGAPALTQSARRLLLTDDGDGGVTLWFWDCQADAPYRCATSSVLQGQLEQTVASYLPNSTSFACQLGGQYGSLCDDQLLTPALPDLPVYGTENPLSGDSDLLARLLRTVDINPHALYTSSEGAQVARDSGCSIRITSSGGFFFFADEDAASPRLPVTAAEELPSELEAVEAAWSLLNRTLAPSLGEARLCLRSCAATEDGWDIRFGFLLSGAQVELSEEGYAARVVVKGRQICEFSMFFRSYVATGEASPLLPEGQAVAALLALHGPGRELLAAYLDAGEDRLSASWIAQ